MTRKRWATVATLAALAVIGVGGLWLKAREEPPHESLPENPIHRLERIPWEGGSEYYRDFPAAARAGWADPSFFPIGIWWSVFDSDADVKWDKKVGINTYVITNPSNERATALMEDNGMSWIGGQLPGMSRDSPVWVGDFLDDEVDGRFEPAEGLKHLEGLVEVLPDHDKIRYTNYTSGILNQWFDKSSSGKYVNDFSDVVSVDQYWHSVDFCSAIPYPGVDYFEIPVPRSSCRTPASYGKIVEMLRSKDALDGKLQPVWNFVENVSGSPAESVSPIRVSVEQVKGAVMNSLIHEARGIVWFSSVFGGPCGSGNAVRSAQHDPKYPCAAQIKAMSEINAQVKELAPALNTQSSVWHFGPRLETMLKVRERDAYIFAMAEGVPGRRSLILPPGVEGTAAEVLFEDRTVPIAGGRIVDNFASSSTSHVYRVNVQ